jgi:hypothetical protein
MARRRKIAGVRFASGRPIPGGMLIWVASIGCPDRVRLLVQLPDDTAYTDIGEVPIIDGEIVIPDDKVFPVG